MSYLKKKKNKLTKTLTMKFNIMHFTAYINEGIKFQSQSKYLTLNGKYHFVNINININITICKCIYMKVDTKLNH